jgi:uncharacterized protein involved in tolerance to divalent cations
MVNILIYLDKSCDAKQTVKQLLSEKLIASASIDENNVSYEIEKDELIERVYSVITAQSKALLFNEVVNAVKKIIGQDVPIVVIPIVASTKTFDFKIKSKTIQI